MNIYFLKKHTSLVGIITLIVIIIAIIIVRFVNKSTPEISNILPKSVSLVSANTFSMNKTFVNADGAIQSNRQADLRSQVTSPVTAVNVSIGNWVSEGQTLVTLKNADIRAQLEQAKANLLLAEAQYSNAGVSLDIAKQGLINKINDAYTKSDDAIRNKFYTLFLGEPARWYAKLAFSTDSSTREDLEDGRNTVTENLESWYRSLRDLNSESDLISYYNSAKSNLDFIKSLLDESSFAVNILAHDDYLTQSQIDLWKLNISNARTLISGAIDSLTAAKQTFENAQMVVKNPEDSSNQVLSTGQAQIQSAKAAVSIIEAQLAKTIITAPFSAKVSAVPVKIGDLVSTGQIVVSLANDSALEVKAYVSDSDISRISVGSKAVIEDGIDGTVTNISPGVDSSNKKVEIKVAVINNKKSSSLVIGQNVSLKIPTKGTLSSSYLVPIQDVKILPNESYVYTVDENSLIKRNDVTLGEITGNYVEIKNGLSDDMNIVSPVYELEVGEKVNIQ